MFPKCVKFGNVLSTVKDHLFCFGSFASVAFCTLGDGSVDMVLFLLRSMLSGQVQCTNISPCSDPFQTLHSTCVGVKGTAWAWEPEITAMAYLLNTTVAVFSKTAKRKANHWAFYRPGPGHPLSNPMILLVNLHRLHFEPVQYYNVP